MSVLRMAGRDGQTVDWTIVLVVQGLLDHYYGLVYYISLHYYYPCKEDVDNNNRDVRTEAMCRRG